MVGQLFARSIAPQRGADVLVKAFGEGFGKPVGQRFQQDIVVIVMRGLEPGKVRFDPVDADREAAQPVAPLVSLARIDEIGQTEVGAGTAFFNLLA